GRRRPGRGSRPAVDRAGGPAGHPRRSRPGAARRAPGLRLRMRLSVAGRMIAAGTGGRDFAAGAPSVLFLHGAGMDHTIWHFPARYFAHRGRAVVAPDLPGHGRSDGPALTGIDALARWVDGLIAELDLESVSLVGHSMGAAVALAVAAGSTKVAKLALLGAAPRMTVHPALMAAAGAQLRHV